jgi:hypothetical protein
MGYRSWLMLITVLGGLLLGPMWAEFGLDEPQNRWIEAGVFLVGVTATIAAWRFLARSFPADEVEDLIPRNREIDEFTATWRRRRGG